MLAYILFHSAHLKQETREVWIDPELQSVLDEKMPVRMCDDKSTHTHTHTHTHIHTHTHTHAHTHTAMKADQQSDETRADCCSNPQRSSEVRAVRLESHIHTSIPYIHTH